MEGDTGLADVFEADHDLGLLAGVVVGDVVGDELLLEALEMEVASVTQEGGAMLIVADVDGVALENLKQLGEDVGTSVENSRRVDLRGSQESALVEAWKDLVRSGKEDGKAKGKIVGVITRGVEYVARYSEMAIADLDVYRRRV